MLTTLPAMHWRLYAQHETALMRPAIGKLAAEAMHEGLHACKVPTVTLQLSVEFQMKFASSEASQWAWHRRPPTSSRFTPLAAAGQRYVPQAADVGCMLRVECTPAAHIPAGVPVCIATVAPLHQLVGCWTDEKTVIAGRTGALPCLTAQLHAGSISSSDSSNGHIDTNGAVDGAQRLRLGDPQAFTFGPVEAGPGADTPTSRRHALAGVKCFTSLTAAAHGRFRDQRIVTLSEGRTHACRAQQSLCGAAN